MAQGQTSDELTVAGVIRDMDYLTFGYWVRTYFGGEDGAMRYQFAAFADGSPDYGTVADLRGSATYEGDATGLFMTKMFDSTDGLAESRPTAASSPPT